MKSNLLRTAAILISIMFVFNACEDEGEEGPKHGDIVGDWNLTALGATYTREVALPADSAAGTTFEISASWNYGATVLGALASEADQTMLTLEDGDVAPGFPVTKTKSDLAPLISAGTITLELVFDDEGGFTLNGTYPTIRLAAAVCSSYSTIAQIADQGNYEITYDANNVGTLTLAPSTGLGGAATLPPFDDGKAVFTNDAANVNLTFLDRDAHDERYIEITDTWDEAEERVTQGVNQVTVNALGGFDPTGTDLSTKGYMMDPVILAAWGGYLTFYALAIQIETKLKVDDLKNPLTDLDGDGAVTSKDMVVYMHADNLAEGGGVSTLQVPYALLVDSTDPTLPVPKDDSGADFDPTSAGAGGKLTYVVNDVCFPVNEMIDFDADFEREE